MTVANLIDILQTYPSCLPVVTTVRDSLVLLERSDIAESQFRLTDQIRIDEKTFLEGRALLI